MSGASTASRLLELLSLLQSRRYWPGAELAERLAVSARTLRRDIDRLRELDYPVTASRGPLGGYQLEVGAQLPPLLLTNAEAVALAVSLRTAVATSSIEGMADAAVGVFAKLEQVLPSRLRARVSALQAAAVPDEPITVSATVDSEVLALLALACRNSQAVRFGYPGSAGLGARHVEPAQLVHRSRLWYLVCFDVDRADWRTFRLDRITRPATTGRTCRPREVPTDLVAALADDSRTDRPAPTFTAVVLIDAPYQEAFDYLGRYTQGLVADGSSKTRWTISSDRLEVLAGALTWLPWSFTVGEAPELIAFLGSFRARLDAAF